MKLTSKLAKSRLKVVEYSEAVYYSKEIILCTFVDFN